MLPQESNRSPPRPHRTPPPIITPRRPTLKDYSAAASLRDELARLFMDSEIGVLSANSGFYQALSRGDHTAMADLWLLSESVVCLHPGHMPCVGHDAARQVVWRSAETRARRPWRARDVDVGAGARAAAKASSRERRLCARRRCWTLGARFSARPAASSPSPPRPCAATCTVRTSRPSLASRRWSPATAAWWPPTSLTGAPTADGACTCTRQAQ